MKILCIVADIKFNKYGGAEPHFIEVLKRILPKVKKYDLIWAKEELVGAGGNLVKFLVSFAFHFVDTVAAVSNYSVDLARKLGAKKLIIIPNGI